MPHTSIIFSKQMFNTAVLNQRINETREDAIFCHKAIEMLVEQYKIHELIKDHSYKDGIKSDDARELAVRVCNGDIPTLDEVIRYDNIMVQEVITLLMYFVGSMIGCELFMILKDSDEEYTDEYYEYLYRCSESKTHYIKSMGYAALTLALKKPPSRNLLDRIFPVNDNDKTTLVSTKILHELNSMVIYRYIEEHDK